MRAVIYSRFSSEKQSETSIEDQERLCRARAARDGHDVIETFSDQALSGSTPLASRPGGRALLAAVLAVRFDVLIVEGLDRLSRDSAESELMCRRIEHRQIRIVGVCDGYDSTSASRKIQRGVRGLINEIYLDDLRAKTHRGLSGQVARGFHAGGLSFGYRSRQVDGGHELEVDEAKAAVVRRILEAFAGGASCQRIAAELNAERAPSPRGGTWAVSAIYGSPKKGAGVLSNELYIGRYVWNRGQWVKDPETGKRQRVERPRSEWIVEDKPELRIVENALWQRVQSRLHKKRELGGSAGSGRRPRVLLGGLMRCAHCGGAVVAVSATAYGCAARKDRGISVCVGVRAPRATADSAVVDYVRELLLAPEQVAAVERDVAEYLAGLRKAARDVGGSRKAEVGALQQEIHRLVDAVSQMGFSEALASRLRAAESRMAALKRAAAPAAAPIVPDALARFRAAVAHVEIALAADIEVARPMLQQLLGVMVVSNDDAGGAWGEIRGEVASLLSLAGTGTDGADVDSKSGCGDRIRISESADQAFSQSTIRRIAATAALRHACIAVAGGRRVHPHRR